MGENYDRQTRILDTWLCYSVLVDKGLRSRYFIINYSVKSILSPQIQIHTKALPSPFQCPNLASSPKPEWLITGESAVHKKLNV